MTALLVWLAVGGLNVARSWFTGWYGLCQGIGGRAQVVVDVAYDLLAWPVQLIFWIVFTAIPDTIESVWFWARGER